MEQHLDPSYFAIIPFPVLEHPDLSDGAKLLYGRITMLQKSTGYCFASNAYLANLVGKKADTVSRLISQLQAAGFLRVEIVRVGRSNQIMERRIYPVLDVYIGKKSDTLSEKNPIPIGKKAEENNISLNNIPPLNPPPERERRQRVIDEATHKPERFEAFWSFYRQNVRGENKQGARKAWDKLKPDDDLIATMAKALKIQIKSESWQAGIGIPYASTWLNNRRWEDEVKAAPAVGQDHDTVGGLERW